MMRRKEKIVCQTWKKRWNCKEDIFVLFNVHGLKSILTTQLEKMEETPNVEEG